MKKLVLMFVAVAAISFASCGNGSKANDAAADSDSVATVDTTVADSTDSTADSTAAAPAADSTAAQADSAK